MNQKKKIRAIGFDFGGVLYGGTEKSVMRQIAAMLGVPYHDFNEEYYKRNQESNVHNKPYAEVHTEIAKLYTKDPNIGDVVKNIHQKDALGKKLNTELVEWIKQIKQSGFKVGIFTNNTTDVRSYLNSSGLTALMDEICISSEIGYQKPDPKAFSIFFEMLGVQPNEAIFVDDTERCLESASTVGYTPLLYTSNEKLKQDLNHLGIKW